VTNSTSYRRLLSAIVLLLLLAAPPVWAADHTNLEQGLPTRLEDAYPLAHRAFEFQGMIRYSNLDVFDPSELQERDDRLTLEPIFVWGFAENWQAKLFAPFFLAEADQTHSGDIGLEALYNFNPDAALPAFALAARVILPTGANSEGVDTTLKFLATKDIGERRIDRLHLNLEYSHKFNRAEDERKDRYAAVLGYSRRLDQSTTFIADFVHELELQELQERSKANVFELGLRRQLDAKTVISVGAGAGIGDNSLDYTVAIGFERSF
jgi:hypothetical protein